MRTTSKVWFTQEQQDDFERFAGSRTLAARLVERAKIVLRAAAPKPHEEMARSLGIVRQTVALWRERFVEPGIDGLQEAPRSGRPCKILPAQIEEMVRQTTRETPDAATPWSTRSLAEAPGVSASTVGRIWRAHGLKPHRVKSFKLSHDPRFAEKLEEVVNLYLPPQRCLGVVAR